MCDYAFGGVFYRDDAVVAGAAFHRLEDVADEAHRPGAHGMAELFERGKRRSDEPVQLSLCRDRGAGRDETRSNPHRDQY